MIIEDEKNDTTIWEESIAEVTADIRQMRQDNKEEFADFLARYTAVNDSKMHAQLQSDLIEHLWAIKGEED